MSRDLLKKLSAILDRGQKIRILGLMVLILIGGLLETASASLILPLVSAILDEEKSKEYTYDEMVRLVKRLSYFKESESTNLDALFKDEKDYQNFLDRHNKNSVLKYI